ncbi:hypothetical protein ACWDBD_49605 [Streptomyces sp. NPDC001118]
MTGEIQAIGRRAFGPEAKVVSAVELGSGMYNNTYRLTVAGQERPVILRIAPEPVRQFRSERELMGNEHASLPYLAVIAPLLPRVIAADWSHEVIGRALRQLRRPERQRLDVRGRMGARQPPQRVRGRLLPLGAGPDRTEQHQAAGDEARRRGRAAGQPEDPGPDGADDPRGLHGRRGRRPGERRNFRPDPMRQHQDRQQVATIGCVFHNYVSTYTFNAAKYPQASSHAWLIQHKLANHPGSKADSKPLYCGSMAGFAAFNANQRLLDRDPYWLNTNMRAACSADSTTVKCTMTANNQ